jgi:L-tartrate/succinate antiporter
MFLTGLAPNLLALSLVKQTAKIDISWTEWFMGIMPVGVLLFIFLPLIVYKIYPPELKSSPDVPIWAGEELKKMGRVSFKEISMALLALLALGLWIFGGDFINATTVALLVLSLMVITRIVEWDDVLAHKQAWNVLVWFATLVTMADGLNKVGFLKWFAGGAAGALSGYSVMTIVVALTVVYFVVHYMFASLTAHTTALLPVLLTAAIAVPEMPVKLISLLFCYTLGLMGIISPYATGPRSDLLRQRLREPERFLEARFDFRRDLPGGAAADRRPLPPLLLELVTRSVEKTELATTNREFHLDRQSHRASTYYPRTFGATFARLRLHALFRRGP